MRGGGRGDVDFWKLTQTDSSLSRENRCKKEEEGGNIARGPGYDARRLPDRNSGGEKGGERSLNPLGKCAFPCGQEDAVLWMRERKRVGRGAYEKLPLPTVGGGWCVGLTRRPVGWGGADVF